MDRFRRVNGKLLFELRGMKTVVEAWGDGILRVRTSNAAILDDLPGALLPPMGEEAQIEIGVHEAHITTGPIRARVDGSGALSFSHDTTEKPLLHETARVFRTIDGGLFRAEVSFSAHDGERFYGLGQRRHGKLDQKGCVLDLRQLNSQVNIPFAVSSNGYGFLWNNPGTGRVELARNHTRWVADATRQIDYLVFGGDTPAQILNAYCRATGFAPAFPWFASGFWQSKLRYGTQKQLLSVAREYKKRGLPLSVIAVDFFHWTRMGDWRFDPVCWPDPQAMVDELRSMEVELLVSVWPTVNPSSANFRYMQDNDMLLRCERGHWVHMDFTDSDTEGPAFLTYYDPTNPAARRFIWEKIRENYCRFGIRLFWLDACEPELGVEDWDNLRCSLGHGREVASLYPFYHSLAFWDGLRALGEQAPLTLCRSAWAGSQRFGAAVWSGDIQTTFTELSAQIRAGLNMAVSGIPWWTTDIGGFWYGDPDDPVYREVLIRWFQYGAFCPLFRLHGCRLPSDSPKDGGPNEVWSYGEEACAIMTRFMRIRERLRPYIMEQMRIVSESGLPPMRPLFVDYPADDRSWKIEDEFLFGPDILVTPVTVAGQRKRTVYLPSGCDWVDVWTHEPAKGGSALDVEAPLGRIPIFVRNGAKILQAFGDENQSTVNLCGAKAVR